MKVIERVHTARKEHICSACGKTINPGEQYRIEAIPAWYAMEAADVDDEGRTVGYLLPEEERKWEVYKLHWLCPSRLYGYGDY